MNASMNDDAVLSTFRRWQLFLSPLWCRHCIAGGALAGAIISSCLAMHSINLDGSRDFTARRYYDTPICYGNSVRPFVCLSVTVVGPTCGSNSGTATIGLQRCYSQPSLGQSWEVKGSWINGSRVSTRNLYV